MFQAPSSKVPPVTSEQLEKYKADPRFGQVVDAIRATEPEYQSKVPNHYEERAARLLRTLDQRDPATVAMYVNGQNDAVLRILVKCAGVKAPGRYNLASRMNAARALCGEGVWARHKDQVAKEWSDHTEAVEKDKRDLAVGLVMGQKFRITGHAKMPIETDFSGFVKHFVEKGFTEVGTYKRGAVSRYCVRTKDGLRRLPLNSKLDAECYTTVMSSLQPPDAR